MLSVEGRKQGKNRHLWLTGWTGSAWGLLQDSKISHSLRKVIFYTQVCVGTTCNSALNQLDELPLDAVTSRRPPHFPFFICVCLPGWRGLGTHPPWDVPSVSSLSAVPFRALTASLTQPQALPLQGCPLLVPEGKSGLTAPSAHCNPVRLSVYSAAAGLRLWMDDRSDADISLRSSIFIFIALAQPRVCVPSPPPPPPSCSLLSILPNSSNYVRKHVQIAALTEERFFLFSFQASYGIFHTLIINYLFSLFISSIQPLPFDKNHIVPFKPDKGYYCDCSGNSNNNHQKLIIWLGTSLSCSPPAFY